MNEITGSTILGDSPVWSPAEHAGIRFRLLAEFDATKVEYDATPLAGTGGRRSGLARKLDRVTNLMFDEFRWLVEHESKDGHADSHDACDDPSRTAAADPTVYDLPVPTRSFLFAFATAVEGEASPSFGSMTLDITGSLDDHAIEDTADAIRDMLNDEDAGVKVTTLAIMSVTLLDPPDVSR